MLYLCVTLNDIKASLQRRLADAQWHPLHLHAGFCKSNAVPILHAVCEQGAMLLSQATRLE